MTAVGPTTASAAGMIYKNYIIRYDRGWDVLCEQYVVQKDEWVLKIFRQKGEIAHADFREFLGIFERLNPHIQNIDMIRPGQMVDIPLRKLEHGALPGQGSGIVTIPFVSLSKVTETVKQHSAAYQIQRGDTVSKLISRHYGRYGSASYNEGVKLFQAANPQITDLNKIYAGQQVYLPDPTIREQTWTAGMSDADGNLKDNAGQTGAAQQDGSPAGAQPLQMPRPDAFVRKEQQGTPLQQAGAALGVKLREKGTYYVPRPGTQDFEIDLSRHPMLDLQSEGKILFSRDGRIMGETPQHLQTFWPQAKVIDIDDESSAEEIIGAVFDALNQAQTEAQGAEVSFSNGGIIVSLRAKWVKITSDQRKICISPINSLDEQTPESMRRYLEQNGIVIKEILPQGNTASESTPGSQRLLVHNVLDLAPTSPKDFVQKLARSLGYTFAPDISFTFPYAGVQVKAYAHLLKTPQGSQVLVDFGDLYGDAVEAIRNTGPGLVQITPEDTYAGIVQKLLDALGTPYQASPSFLAARRSPEFNASVTVPGILVEQGDEKRTLLSSTALPPAITDLLGASGVNMVLW